MESEDTSNLSTTTHPNLYEDYTNDSSCDIVPPEYITRQLPFSIVVYTMYSTIFVVALLGNLFVCYIVLQSPRMRTVTNYFIMNLAVGDILTTLLCVPFTSVPIMLQYWPFGAFMCPLVNYVTTLSVFVSAYTMVAISIDKWRLIIYPLKPRMSKKCASFIILGVWITACLTVVPTGVFSTIIQPTDQYGNESIYHKCGKYSCQENYSSVGDVYHTTYTIILMGLQYIIPLIVLIFTYTSIAAVIWCHRIPGEAENARDMRMARSKRKMIKMMITVVLVFTMCWLPYNLYMLYDSCLEDSIKPYVFISVHCLAMSHACYNPIIYCYMNTRFRDGLFLILRTMPCFKSCYLRNTRGSMSSGFRRNPVLLEGTDSTILQRNNTFTTYITLNRKNRTSMQQNASRSTSQLRASQSSNGTTNNRKKKLLNEVADEPI